MPRQNWMAHKSACPVSMGPLREVTFEVVGAARPGLHVLHADVEPAADLTDPGGPHEVRVRAEIDPDARFFLEHRPRLRIAQEFGAKGLHRQDVVARERPGEIDDTEAALAEFLDDL
jgi:hypothetical protein